MLVEKNEQLESRNFVDGIDFTKDDPCIFVVYPAGAAGDLLISIIDKHYLRTGCEYYGISDTGRVHMFTTDYEELDQSKYKFDQQFFHTLAENLGNRHLNYSLLDQVIFGCHRWKDDHINQILETFPKAKIIRIVPKDQTATNIISSFAEKKVTGITNEKPQLTPVTDTTINSPRVLEIPFGALFTREHYLKSYDKIIKFLNLNGRLICFDYVQYYLTKQDPEIAKTLEEYSQTL